MGRGVAAVVFDLDGVLIDSEPVWEQVRHGLVDERGGRWPLDAQTRLIGMSTAEWARYLSEELGVDLTPDRVATVVIDRMSARYAGRLPLLPGADGALRRLAARWRLALASSSPRRLVDTVLAAAGWGALFEATVSTDEVATGKPAPDVYRAVAGRLGCHPRPASRSRIRVTGCGPRLRRGCGWSPSHGRGIRRLPTRWSVPRWY